MNALQPVSERLAALAERLDALSLRERGLIFFAGATLVFLAWQILLMSPLTTREHNMEQRLAEARRRLIVMDQLGSAASAANDPLITFAARNRALKSRLDTLQSDLRTAAQGYVVPGRMTDMLRQILSEQRGLKMVSLANLPATSLSTGANATAETKDIGPFLHPVELVVEGDYASVVTYLLALEALPWRVHWESLELRAEEYPINQVRIVIGALSLSREWISL